jgi:MFS family permease
MGFGFASWASRIAQVRAEFGLAPGALGLLLLAIAAGSCVSLPCAGLFVDRVGPARAITTVGLISATGVAVAGIGVDVNVWVVAVGLFLLGVGNGGWDVAVNVEGASIERRLGRTILPRVVASYSVGTVAGSLVGTVLVVAGVPVTPHLVAAGLLIAGSVPIAARRLPGPVAPVRPGREHARHAFAAWTERRTLLLGLFVFCCAFMEGAGNDWLGVALIDGYGASAAVGTLALGCFLVAITAGRWFGGGLVRPLGRRASAVLSVAVASAGVTIVLVAGWIPAALAGAVLWGLGGALGFPLGMSVAGDDPEHAAGRVGAVTAISWLAFLLGPPVVGLLGSRVGTLHSLVSVLAFGLIGIALSGGLSARAPQRPRSSRA